MLKMLAAAFCLALVCAGTAQAQVFVQKGANLDGEVLMTSVGSMFYQAAGGPSVVTTALDCQKSCSMLPSCSGYVFCTKTEGCGGWCRDWLADKPPAQPSASAPTSPNPAWKLPISGMGPWGPTSTCAPSGAWPYRMCTLKMIDSFTDPKKYGDEPKDGWVSGWLTTPMPVTCSGISHAACTRCNALSTTTDINGCLACATGLKVPTLAFLGTNMLDTRAEVCASCYSKAANPAECVKCLGTTTDAQAPSCISAAAAFQSSAALETPSPVPTPVRTPSPSPSPLTPSAGPVPSSPSVNSTTPGTETTPSAANNTTIIGAAVGAVIAIIAIAAVAFFVMRRRQKVQDKQVPQGTPGPYGKQGHSPPDVQSFPTSYIGGFPNPSGSHYSSGSTIQPLYGSSAAGSEAPAGPVTGQQAVQQPPGYVQYRV